MRLSIFLSKVHSAQKIRAKSLVPFDICVKKFHVPYRNLGMESCFGAYFITRCGKEIHKQFNSTFLIRSVEDNFFFQIFQRNEPASWVD